MKALSLLLFGAGAPLLVGCGSGASDTAGPTVVNTVPRNGEVGVDPELAALRVTFSESMDDGWSWVTETDHAAPEVTGFAFYIDELTNILPVELAPRTSYAVWVNSPDEAELRKFTNLEGVAARAYRIEFETR